MACILNEPPMELTWNWSNAERMRKSYGILRGVISVEPIDEGYAVAVEITDAEYELDDDEEGSAISELRAAGFDAEWRDDYEPQENGRTRVTIFAVPRSEKCEDCAVRFLAKDGFCADDMVLCRA